MIRLFLYFIFRNVQYRVKLHPTYRHRFLCNRWIGFSKAYQLVDPNGNALENYLYNKLDELTEFQLNYIANVIRGNLVEHMEVHGFISASIINQEIKAGIREAKDLYLGGTK